MYVRPFRFGVVGGHSPSHSAWVATARRAEELGYSTLVVPDHFETGIAPLTALAVAAEATKTLRVGGLVFCNDFRHPAVLAKEVATLDLLSDGRCEIGLGAGYLAQEYEQAGIPFERPGIRVSRLEEAVQVIKQFFTEEQVNFSGKHYTLAGLQGRPKPLQKPYPPLYIGGSGKRLLSMAAQQADSVGISFTEFSSGLVDVSPATIQQKVDWVRQAAQERLNELEFGYTIYVAQIADDRQPTKPGAHLPSTPHVVKGSVKQIIEELLDRRERYGFSYVQVTGKLMETFAPIVAQLAGK